MVDVPAYLARIAYSGPTDPTAETLRLIHRAHLLTVPFENLDIALGRKLVVDEEANVRKIVDLHRGGFCYELNGAFAALLRTLGFRVTLLSARVTGQGGKESPEFDHLTLQVDLEEPWLADVGFGESFIEPLRIAGREEQADPAGKFRLVEVGNRLRLEKVATDGQWRRQYSFSFEPHTLQEFAGRCHYHQTSPDSHFMQNRICTRATPHGRITLSEMKLIVTRQGDRAETIITSEEEKVRVLHEHFRVRL
jgi:N-hydroxyarylamine O-acetyltransferase